jgi:hypothetical protein
MNKSYPSPTIALGGRQGLRTQSCQLPLEVGLQLLPWLACVVSLLWDIFLSLPEERHWRKPSCRVSTILLWSGCTLVLGGRSCLHLAEAARAFQGLGSAQAGVEGTGQVAALEFNRSTFPQVHPSAWGRPIGCWDRLQGKVRSGPFHAGAGSLCQQLLAYLCRCGCLPSGRPRRTEGVGKAWKTQP